MYVTTPEAIWSKPSWWMYYDLSLFNKKKQKKPKQISNLDNRILNAAKVMGWIGCFSFYCHRKQKSEIYIDGCVWSIGRVLGNGNIAGQCNIRNNVKFRLVTVLSRPGRWFFFADLVIQYICSKIFEFVRKTWTLYVFSSFRMVTRVFMYLYSIIYYSFTAN
jgi:hypothetical protein